MEKGDFEAALKAATKALEDDEVPKANVLFVIGQCYDRLDKPLMAISAFGKAAQEAPDWMAPYEATLELCTEELYKMRGDAQVELLIQTMTYVSDALLFLDPENPVAGAVEPTLSDLMSMTACPEDAEALDRLRRGEEEFAKSRYLPAVTEYEKALEIDKNCARLHRYLGDAWFARGDYPSAAQAYLKAVEIEPDDSLSRLAMARIYFDAGGHARSLEETLEAIRLQPHNPLAWNLYSMNMSFYGRPGDRFVVPPRAKVDIGEDGEPTVRSHPLYYRRHPERLPLQQAWRAWASIRALWMTALYGERHPDDPVYRTTFEELRQAWSELLAVYRDIIRTDPGAADPDLDRLGSIESDGFLDAYIFHAAYERSMKEEYLRWKEENGEKDRRFIERYLMRVPDAVNP